MLFLHEMNVWVLFAGLVLGVTGATAALIAHQRMAGWLLYQDELDGVFGETLSSTYDGADYWWDDKWQFNLLFVNPFRSAFRYIDQRRKQAASYCLAIIFFVGYLNVLLGFGAALLSWISIDLL